MTIGGDYGSDEKQAIREMLWDAAFVDLIEGRGTRPEDIRYLCLPGARCVYLRHIVETFGIDIGNVVAVEQFEEPFLAIHHFLAGKGVTRHSTLEDLCDSGELSKYFPMDVVNLDFCGQGFVFPDLGNQSGGRTAYQRRWDCVKEAIRANNEHKIDVWHLLLTLSCNRNNPAGRRYLLGQIEELANLTGIKKATTNWPDNRLIQEAVPKIIADEALQHDFFPVYEAFDSRRYRQKGSQHQMAAWHFKFELDKSKQLGKAITKRNRALDQFCTQYYSEDGKELIL